MSSSLFFVLLFALQSLLTSAIPLNSERGTSITASALSDPKSVAGYAYLGCYAEPTTGRALTTVTSDSNMTLGKCATLCSTSTNSAYFGVEYGVECWCGNTLASGASLVDASACSSPCSGNKSETCGAGLHLNLYKNRMKASPAFQTIAGGYVSQGCYIDNGNPRVLATVVSNNVMTLEKCASYCAGIVYMGIEFADECWCGSTLNGGRFTADTDCNMVCAGNSSTFCGAGNRLNLYKLRQTLSTTSTTTRTPDNTRSSPSLTSNRGSSTPTSVRSSISSTKSSTITTSRLTTSTSSVSSQKSTTGTSSLSTTKPSSPSSSKTSTSISSILTTSAINPAVPSGLILNNAQAELENGQTVYLLSPPPGGQASIQYPVNIPNISPGSQVLVEANYKTSELAIINRRAVLTQCTLIIYLGGIMIYSNAINTTDGSYVTVSSLPTGAQTVSTLIILESCFDVATPVTVGNINIELVAAQTHLTTTSSTSTQPTVPSGVLITTQTSPSTESTSASPVSTSIAVTFPTVCDTSSTSNTGTYTINGQIFSLQCNTAPDSDRPIQLVQVMTFGECINACATDIANGCIGVYWSQLATDKHFGYPYCALVNFIQGPYQPYIGQHIALLETSSASSSSQTPSMVLPTTQTSVSASPSFSSTAIPPLTTTAPLVGTYLAVPFTSGACTRNAAASCTLSGAPVATSGLLAIATGVPLSAGGNYEPAYEQCARVCASITICNSWNLDREAAADGTWSCYVYSGLANTYAVSYNSLYSATVWFSSTCFNCQPQALGISSSSSIITIAPLVTTPAAVLTNYVVEPYTASTCSKPAGYNSCTLSGAPLATSGFLAEASGVPVAVAGNNAPAYEECAGICYNVPTCNSWALDRGVGVYPSSQLPSWTCFLYSGAVNTYAISYNNTYMAIVWFGRGCYDCNQRNLAIVPPAVTVSASPSSSQSSSSSETSTTDSLPISHTSSISTRTPTITTALAYTSGACNRQVVASCTLSGAPVATSGLLAVGTGIPAASGSSGFESQYQECAFGCTQTNGCNSFALDRGNWPTSTADWTCYFYSGAVNTYAISYNSAYAAIVWFSSNCYDCTIAAPTTLLTSNSSSRTLSQTSSSTTSSINFTPISSTQTIASTTSAPSVTSVPTISAPPLATSCSHPTGAWYTNGCTQSGYATATSGLIAVATGVVPPAAGTYDFETRYQQCASVCAGITGCTGYALDRGSWPTDLSDWTCYLYELPIQSYLVGKTSSSIYAEVVWMSELCYACSPLLAVTSSLAASSTTFSLSISSLLSLSTSSFTTSSSFISSSTTSPTSIIPTPSTTATCTRNPLPPIDEVSMACDIQGYSEPDNISAEVDVFTRADCAAYCYTVNQSTPGACASFMFSGPSSFCGIWTTDAWTAIDDNTIAGRSMRENVMDDAGCWSCHTGVVVGYVPVTVDTGPV